MRISPQAKGIEFKKQAFFLLNCWFIVDSTQSWLAKFNGGEIL